MVVVMAVVRVAVIVSKNLSICMLSNGIVWHICLGSADSEVVLLELS